MPTKTKIEWTDFSSNPLRYRDRATGEVLNWACVKLSPGCKNCYSDNLARRFIGRDYNAAEMANLEPFMDSKELSQILKSRALSGQKMFPFDMTDLFGEWVPDALIDRWFAVMAVRHDVTFQVVTKRAKRMREYIETPGREAAIQNEIDNLEPNGLVEFNGHEPDIAAWPLPNVWLIVSCEDQKHAEERIPHLLNTPAAVHGVSLEPLLAPIDLKNLDTAPELILDALTGIEVMGEFPAQGPRLSWVIVGGESGTGARPCEIEWIEAVVKDCQSAGVPVFVKQLGSAPTKLCPSCEGKGTGASFIPGKEWGIETFCGRCMGGHRQSVLLNHSKGGDIAEFPPHLQVREFPATEARL